MLGCTRIHRARASLLAGLAVASVAACSRRVYHPTATSDVLSIGAAQRQGAFERGRWHEGLETDRLRGATVRISVEQDGRSFEGSGVAVCQIGRDVYLLTANHVTTPRADGSRQIARDKAYRIQLAHTEVPPVVVGASDELWVRRDPGVDVALVRVTLASDAVRVPPVSFVQRDAVSVGSPIRTFGYSTRGGREWMDVAGAVLAIDGTTLSYEPAVAPGFSGGPVFDASGFLVGINLNTDAGRTTSVLRVQSAIRAVDASLPLSCPRPG